MGEMNPIELKADEEIKKRIADYRCLIAALNTDIPFYHKLTLTLEEAAHYVGIGVNRMREISDINEDLIIWNGRKRLIKRKELEDLIQKEYSL